MTSQLPLLADTMLTGATLPHALPVDTAGWFAWLDDPASRAFAFRDAAGTFTARKERKQRGSSYWVAYRKVAGKLRKQYLGKSPDLTMARLRQAAAVLQPRADQPPATASPLLRSKLFAPPTRAALVPRTRLWARLDASVDARLVLVAAPAGFGKTTLLQQWSVASGQSPTDASTDHRPPITDHAFAWLALDAADNDPVVFVRYLVAALQGIAPALGVAALALLDVDHGRAQVLPLSEALAALVNDLAALPTHCWLVLDDYHVIQAPAVHEALLFLIEHLPPRLHVVLATREDPPLPLARLRARRELIELRAADLRFTAAEAASFLREVMALPLAAAEVATLESRTEGWIAGLQLAALALQQRSDYAAFVAGFAGTHRYVMEYLVEDVLGQLPAPLQRFLLQTAILQRLSAPLCAAVLDIADEIEAQALLDDLERGNVFVVPLDDERRWYRYHHLFADALRSQLEHSASQPRIAELHRRASAWYAAHDLPHDAIRHAFAAGDAAYTAGLIEAEVMPALLQGLGATVDGWLAALPPELRETRPRLLLAQVWLAMVRADYATVGPLLAAAEAALPRTDTSEVVQGELAGTRAIVAGLLGDPAAVEHGRAALQQLPSAHPLWATVALMLGYTFLNVGDLAGADTMLRQTLAAAAPDPRFVADRATLLAITAMVRRAQGRLDTAAQLCADALALVRQGEQLKPLAGSCLALMTNATIEYERNALDVAAAQLEQCRALAQQCGMAVADVLGRFYMAPILAARDDLAGAIALLDETLAAAHAQGSPAGTVREIEGSRCLLWLRQGALADAQQWAARWSDADRAPLTPYDYDRFALVRLRMAEGDWNEAEQQLADLLRRTRVTGHRRFEVWALVLAAALHYAAGAHDAALQWLDEALALAAPERYIRMFVDEGQPIAALLRRYAARRGRHAAYARQILAAFPSQPAPTTAALVEPLTAREREVLQLVAAGASNREIADRLIITPGTVKKYVHAICGKLGVQRRTQAVAEARSLGLL